MQQCDNNLKQKIGYAFHFLDSQTRLLKYSAKFACFAKQKQSFTVCAFFIF